MEDAPSTKSEDSKEGFSFWPFVLWPLLLAFVYSLSVGPAAKLTLSDRINAKTFETVYAPIGWLYKHTFMEKPIGMYLHLWIPEWIDEHGETK